MSHYFDPNGLEVDEFGEIVEPDEDLSDDSWLEHERLKERDNEPPNA